MVGANVSFENAKKQLSKDGVIAFPTDTLYGIAAQISSEIGYRRIYEIKGRSEAKPVAVCFSTIPQILEYLPSLDRFRDLLSRLLPGPVTLVVPRGKFIPEHVNPNCETIGIRIPDNTISRLLSAAEPLCLTSANKSGAKSAITSNDFADLHPLLDAIVETELGIPSSMSRAGSTVVELDLEAKTYLIRRKGCAFDATVASLTAEGFKST